MADDVRLYMFQSGVLKTVMQSIKMNQGLGEPYEIPVPWYAVTHPRGNVVIDGGNAAECAVVPRGHWGAICDVYYPELSPEEGCLPQLEQVGIDPASVTHILLSHLHLDHTGALGAVEAFPNARVVATRAEYEYGHAPDWFADGGYIRADFVKPGIEWVLLEPTADGYDLF